MESADALLENRIAALDVPALRARYLEDGEFLQLPEFLPAELLRAWEAALPALAEHGHRNFIPGHKKGEAVSFPAITAVAPAIAATYRSPAFAAFVEAIVGEPILECPDSDLHRCALYGYTEPGDHIGFHYDTSYYRGRRYTVLIGLEDRSTSRLVARLHTKTDDRMVEERSLATPPGSFIVFNGDALLHKVTALGENERRFVVTMEYVTDPGMQPFLRFVSNMKDAIAYFGFKSVFGGRPGAS